MGGSGSRSESVELVTDPDLGRPKRSGSVPVTLFERYRYLVSTVPGVQSYGLDPLFASCLEHDPPRPDVSPAEVHSLRKE
jgi:hypothetical protein